MKAHPLSILVITFCLSLGSSLSTPAETLLSDAPLDSVIVVEGRKNMFQSGPFYFAGQPNLETLRWLKSEGVTVVVNLRTENENREFAEASFNEENMVKELGMSYCPLPVGDKDSYSPATVDKFADILKNNTGKALVHCLSAGRVTTLWMAYLVRHRKLTLDEAVLIGKKMRFTMPLEDFLGVKILMQAGKSQ